MRDRRPVNSLDIHELEHVIRMRRHAKRVERLRPGDPVGRPATTRRQWVPLDFLLAIVELGAVAGLGYLLVGGASTLRALNTRVAEALAPPTLTPTPLVAALFLPDGHTPPNSPGGAQPYEASLPEGLRYLITPVPPVPLPTEGPQQPRRMTIPSIRVDAPVVQGVGWEQLKKGIGQVPGTALPGQVGNSVYGAHNDTYGETFRDLDQLKPGNEVFIFTAAQQFRYVVREWRIVEPTEVGVMDPTPTPTVTLISCYPYLVDTQRIVVFADLAAS